MSETLKDQLYSRAALEEFAAAFKAVDSDFDSEDFLRRVFDDQWESRELKQRTHHIAQVLRAILPPEYHAALAIMRQAAPHLRRIGFLTITFCDYVEMYGLDDWEASIPALEEFNRLCTSEWAVRPFILRNPQRMMAQMLEWARSEDVNSRRLASEGCRPRLPWGISLPIFKEDPTPILPILEQLKLDESEDVRRSVANNLNDIAKDNPQVTLDVLQRWQIHHTPEMQKLTRHALRTLIKAGNPAALALLGYGVSAVTVKELTLERNTVRLGEKLSFSFVVESVSDAPQNLVIDYVLHFRKANGKQSPKVFKLTKKTLQPGEKLRIQRQHRFALITTRVYYPGEQAIEIQINGQRYEHATFVLRE